MPAELQKTNSLGRACLLYGFALPVGCLGLLILSPFLVLYGPYSRVVCSQDRSAYLLHPERDEEHYFAYSIAPNRRERLTRWRELYHQLDPHERLERSKRLKHNNRQLRYFGGMGADDYVDGRMDRLPLDFDPSVNVSWHEAPDPNAS